MIKQMRINKGYTQEELSNILGVSSNYIENIEGKGKKISSPLAQLKICNALDMSVKQINLLFGEKGTGLLYHKTESEKFRKIIKERRQSKGYSLGQLGELVGCPANYINRIENGEVIELKSPLIFKLSEVLEVSKEDIDDIFGKDIYEEEIEENKFGDLVKEKREERGYSYAQLGELSGLSASYISRLEKGERRAPSYSVIQKLSEALEMNKNELESVFGQDNIVSDKTDSLVQKKLAILNDYILICRTKKAFTIDDNLEVLSIIKDIIEN